MPNDLRKEGIEHSAFQPGSIRKPASRLHLSDCLPLTISEGSRKQHLGEAGRSKAGEGSQAPERSGDSEHPEDLNRHLH